MHAWKQAEPVRHEERNGEGLLESIPSERYQQVLKSLQSLCLYFCGRVRACCKLAVSVMNGYESAIVRPVQGGLILVVASSVLAIKDEHLSS